MDVPTKPSSKHTPCLADLLTPAQESKLAFELAKLMRDGRGELEIEVIDGRVWRIKPKPWIDMMDLLTE